jgi:hypothetical protein
LQIFESKLNNVSNLREIILRPLSFVATTESLTHPSVPADAGVREMRRLHFRYAEYSCALTAKYNNLKQPIGSSEIAARQGAEVNVHSNLPANVPAMHRRIDAPTRQEFKRLIKQCK